MSSSVAGRVEVRLDGADGTPTGLQSRSARTPDAAVSATRDELGLGGWHGAATGHQPIFWHGGILAKALCAAELSRASGGGWLHLIADHDAVDPAALPYPARRAADEIRCATAHFCAPAAPGTAAAAIASSSVRPRDLACPAPPASADVAARLDGIAVALACADASRGSAWRTVEANFAILAERGALERPAQLVCASSLLRTSLGRQCVERIAADPEACAAAFNAALAHAPRAASRLRVDGAASEVPLWEVGDRGARKRISGERLRELLRDGALGGHNGTLGSPAAVPRPAVRVTGSGVSSPTCALLPRAFLATGIIRALGIRFVHGTGGEAYERAGDAWWRTALGRALPPFCVATGDLRFVPESLGLRAGAAKRTLTWRDAWVDPARLDGVARDPVLARSAAAIASMPRRSAERRRAFEAMRARVHAMRDRRRPELDALASEDAAHRSMRASLDAAADRAYPAALHDADALAGLSALVAEAVSASVASGASGSRR